MGSSPTQPWAGPGTGTTDSADAPTMRIGVDVVDVRRFARMLALRGDALCEHVFTPAELTVCRGRTDRLAGRAAAKEAVAKALGVGIGPVGWRDVEVLPEAGGPTVRLAGRAVAAARERGLERWALSLSVGAGTAVAVVVATGGRLP